MKSDNGLNVSYKNKKCEEEKLCHLGKVYLENLYQSLLVP